MTSITDLSGKPHVYSWSTKVDFEINSVGHFSDFSTGQTKLNWSQDLILTLEKRQINPELAASGISGYRLILEAAQTACEAEGLGKRLACALLKFAIDKNWGLRLSWHDTPLPCRVIDRTASRGLEAQMFGSMREFIALSEFAGKLDETFSSLSDAPYRVLLSMELCASARFETDNRAKLILLVSALEALSEQQDLSDQLSNLISSLIASVEQYEFKDKVLKRSIIGQINSLRRESIRRAIKRTLNEANIYGNDVDFVNEIYSMRSRIVHEGARVPELALATGRLDSIIKSVYHHIIGVQHAKPA